MTRWETNILKLLRVLRLETIRNKLLAFAVLATLIPSISTAWISYVQNKRALTEKIAQELASVSSQAAREQDLWIKERLYDLRVFASSYEVSENLGRLAPGSGGAPQTRLNDYLNSVRERFLDYEELMVVDPRGRVVATSARKARGVPFPPGWQSEMQGDGAVLGAPHWDDTLGKAVMVVAVPIGQATSRLLGALTARLDLHGVSQILQRFTPGDSGRIWLAGAGGELINSSSGASSKLMHQSLPPEALQNLSAHEGTAVEYASVDGTEVVGTLTAIPHLGWSVVAEIPSAEAYRQVNRLRDVTILMVAGLLFGVGLLAYLLGLLIVRPLDRLTQGAAEVAGGDLAVDLPVLGGGEVGALTEVFNHMVTRLREGRQELERLSITDGLTGLFNRRYLIERLTGEVTRARRGQHRFAVLMTDVDHFKDYNDAHGHLAGDGVLARVAAILRENVREVDCAARYGGEEFFVLLAETDVEGAVEVAERVRARLAEESFDGGKITLSMGVAAFPELGETPEALIMSADAALYQAKAQGRDRVVRATLVGGPEVKHRA